MAQQLNLARKWRSKQFDQIVGQQLSVRMLKNSLYLNQFFPVYLFSGQRGCGKTTTARVFAAALNCEQLPEFQKNPKSVAVPCLQCASCKAMQEGNHPDFIEIDAASHTGVDNVRTIIDAASLLPVMGRRKIYLIDEAHMLSKAAFNAFLKIMEEPPDSVIFMLATTDPQKIIETVRSRSFQLFFTAIESESLIAHLKNVCEKESLHYEEGALALLVAETEGSARDALNLLEQVRFSHAKITKQAILDVLGHMDERSLIHMIDTIVSKNTVQLLQFFETQPLSNYDVLAIWNKFQELLRFSLFVKYGVKKLQTHSHEKELGAVLHKCTSTQLNAYLKTLYENEMVFSKTINQGAFLEVLCIQMCGISPLVEEKEQLQSAIPEKIEQIKSLTIEKKPSEQIEVLLKETDERWSRFIGRVNQLSDPLLQSIFKQAYFVQFDATTHEVSVQFSQEVSFFSDWLLETKGVWGELLEESFGSGSVLKQEFKEDKKSEVQAKPVVEKSVAATGSVSHKVASLAVQKKPTIVNISDKEKWEKANKLVDVFGGTVVEVQSDEKV